MSDLLIPLADGLAALLVLAGALFSLVGAIGILKLQDAIIRMHASSKAGVFGSALILLAVALVYVERGSIVVQAILAILFLLITAPVAAHVIGRHAYRAGIPLWKGTWVDELAAFETGRRRAASPEAANGEASPDLRQPGTADHV